MAAMRMVNKSARCPACKSAYCSSGCRILDQIRHQRICKHLCKGVSRPKGYRERICFAPGSSAWSPPRGLDRPMPTPFYMLNNKVWMHGRPERDVYRLLIDAYRLRMHDKFVVERCVDPDSVLGGHPTGIPSFRHFVDLAAARDYLLPS